MLALVEGGLLLGQAQPNSDALEAGLDATPAAGSGPSRSVTPRVRAWHLTCRTT